MVSKKTPTVKLLINSHDVKAKVEKAKAEIKMLEEKVRLIDEIDE